MYVCISMYVCMYGCILVIESKAFGYYQFPTDMSLMILEVRNYLQSSLALCPHNSKLDL